MSDQPLTGQTMSYAYAAQSFIRLTKRQQKFIVRLMNHLMKRNLQKEMDALDDNRKAGAET